ncbi:ATP-binding cassette sub-family G member [Elysia marginata]|uniref:ATP-binding cassette sub-family G member n=1 Tax=Elysia marginata TaxID=1093978 RepID=A0AAV4HUY7_9GAST|nr:ATP-binding cassette sub-family G member [Elysia marginata]
MLLNGVPLSPGAIKNVSAYVQQGDLFMETLTVREQLQFRALLRMDNKLDHQARLKRVEEVIQEMGLISCAESRIGASSGTKKGISGGERKRLSFASEALTNPPIFFCDEPTSSLDSFMAQSIVHTLQKMAERGRVILCTIHQPSSELFDMFSQVLLLSEGRVAFMGSRQDALTFFESQGHMCPENFNPGDHYILTLAIVPGKEIESKRKTQAICETFTKTDHMKELEERIQDQKKDVDMYDHIVLDQITGQSRYSSSIHTQLRMLFWRAWVAQFRNVMLFGVRIGQVVVSRRVKIKLT